MRWILIVALAACGTKHDPTKEKEPTKEELERPRPPPRKANTLARVETKAPFEIKNVEVLPIGTMDGPVAGQYSTSFEATRDGQRAKIEAHMRCRVEDYNLVNLNTSSSESRQDTAFWGDPFGMEARVCEIRWFEMVKGRESVVARACYSTTAKSLSDGECNPSAFKKPSIPDGFAIDFKPVPSPKRFENPIPPISMNQGNVQFSALVTLSKPLGDKVAGYKLRCEDGKTVGTAEDTNEFVPLWRLEAGESAYAWEFVFHGDKALQAMTELERCELEILAVAPDATKMAGESLGRFCVAKNGDTTPGACVPAIGKPR